MSLPQNDLSDKSRGDDKTEIMLSTSNVEAGENVATVLTAVGRSAVAVVAAGGRDALEQVLLCFRPASEVAFLPGQVRFGRWTISETEPGESVVLTPMETADPDFQELEIHCHGGSAAIDRVLADLSSVGFRIVDETTWKTKICTPLLISEAQIALSACLTPRTAAIAIDQVRGAMMDWATDTLASLRNASSSGESISIESVRRQAAQINQRAAVGTRLIEPFRVVLAGAPNVGKSSLINAVIGYDRSITMDVAGTTRDVLQADTVIGGLPIRISDTAGIRESDEPIEREGVDRAQQAAREADLVLWVEEPCGHDEPIRIDNERILRVLNKSDLLEQTSEIPSNMVAVSALLGDGIDRLLSEIERRLMPSQPPPGSAVPLNRRQQDLISKIGSSESTNQIQSLLAELLGL